MPDNPTSIDEIKSQLARPYIHERQVALEKIKGMLDRNEQVPICVELLQMVISTSEYLIVAGQARKILDDWQSLDPIVRMQDDQKHIFGAVCPKCGFENYYDKRHVCGSQGSIFLGKAEDQTDELQLECQSCHESFVVYVNCEGYK